jgi:LysR family transcriptional regulator, transcriptional activator of nhaA
MSDLNYRHLYYFWVVAKEGGFARAALRLDMAIQTVSAQVRELERSLGHQLLRPSGRGVALTEAGRVALEDADEVFRVGQRLRARVVAAATRPTVRLAVGLSDGLSKLTAHGLLDPVLHTPDLHLVCHEGEFEPLLSELALHHLDIVLAGQPAPANPNLKLGSARIAEEPIDWYGPRSMTRSARARAYPACLAELPVLLPTAHSALRDRLDRWFAAHSIVPRVVGEFEDSALMAVFGAKGLGVFPISRAGARDMTLLRGVRLLGECDGVHEDVHAIWSHRSLHHPLVKVLRAGAGR